MKTIIAGSKTIQSYPLVINHLSFCPWLITTVFSGMRPGPDILGFRWALERKIPVRQFKPDWVKLGKPADLIKCFEMAAFADALFCITDGSDHVAEYQIKIAKACSVKTHVIYVPRQQQTIVSQGRSESVVHSSVEGVGIS